MKSVGLDIATNTGMALVGDGEDRGKAISLPKQRGMLRLRLIAEEVAKTLAVWSPDLVVIEDYTHCLNFRTTVILVECGTVIREVVHYQKIPWVEVEASTLKKWTTGKGNAKKEQMALAAKERWHYQSPSHDVIDAYCLAQMGQLGMEQLLAIDGVSLGA